MANQFDIIYLLVNCNVGDFETYDSNTCTVVKSKIKGNIWYLAFHQLSIQYQYVLLNNYQVFLLIDWKGGIKVYGKPVLTLVTLNKDTYIKQIQKVEK